MALTREAQDEARGPLKAALWEEAKGKLRAFAAVQGSYHSYAMSESDGEAIRARWQAAEKSIAAFIEEFESHGLHE